MSHCTDDKAPVATAHQLDWAMMMMIMTLVTAANVSQLNYNCRYTNASTVPRDWLECDTAGQQSKFNLVVNLENLVVSCRRMQQTTIRDFFNHSDHSSQPQPRSQNHPSRNPDNTSVKKYSTKLTYSL